MITVGTLLKLLKYAIMTQELDGIKLEHFYKKQYLGRQAEPGW